ncbi:hypothetical protein C2S51_003123 [Perilla frutescens var. frutescens]|nr:hypothetical protein C2S51_003123 [Perilla frutescens var. frutescens]
MATSLQTLIPLLCSIALLLTLANAAQPQPRPRPRPRTIFNYNFNRDKPTDLTYQGDANFPTGTAVLRLTKTDVFGNPQPNSIGRVLYTRPVIFSRRQRQANFQTTVRFIIRPYSGGCGPADGLAFFIAPVNSTVGAGGGNFGIFDASGNNPSVFAVEFDVYSNDWDPSYRHVGIDIQSRISSNVTEVGDALLGQEVAAQINYDPATKLISVDVTAGSKSFGVRYVYDLSTILPQQVQVGISAATGTCVAVHDVVAWSFDSIIVRT